MEKESKDEEEAREEIVGHVGGWEVVDPKRNMSMH